MTLNASLDRFFETKKSIAGPFAEALIAHLARDGFTILPDEDLAEYSVWRAWRDVELD